MKLHANAKTCPNSRRLLVDRIEREGWSLAAAVDLAAYRVVQEALTNVLKHAGKVRADVSLQVTAASLDIEVSDRGRAPSPNGQGHGLVGMRERLALYGGSVS